MFTGTRSDLLQEGFLKNSRAKGAHMGNDLFRTKLYYLKRIIDLIGDYSVDSTAQRFQQILKQKLQKNL